MFSYVLQALLGALFAIVTYQLLTGAIATRGMLSGTSGQRIDPERLQSLVVSMAAIGSYAGSVLTSPVCKVLPEVSYPLLATFTGSQLLYLTGKLIRLFK